MSDNQQQALNALTEQMIREKDSWVSYWNSYSNMGTWQFWVLALMLIVPLIVLYFALDREKAFRIGFFGLTIHMLSTYIDTFATSHGLWEYPYKLSPHLPASFGLDASLIPVTFMLLYQWTLNHNKNYYLYGLVLCASFAFAFKPFLSAMGLFRLYSGTTFFGLFLWYIAGGLGGKWITDAFVKLHHMSKTRTAR